MSRRGERGEGVARQRLPVPREVLGAGVPSPVPPHRKSSPPTSVALPCRTQSTSACPKADSDQGLQQRPLSVNSCRSGRRSSRDGRPRTDATMVVKALESRCCDRRDSVLPRPLQRNPVTPADLPPVKDRLEDVRRSSVQPQHPAHAAALDALAPGKLFDRRALPRQLTCARRRDRFTSPWSLQTGIAPRGSWTAMPLTHEARRGAQRARRMAARKRDVSTPRSAAAHV
jgi:hypothetical protein